MEWLRNIRMLLLVGLGAVAHVAAENVFVEFKLDESSGKLIRLHPTKKCLLASDKGEVCDNRETGGAIVLYAPDVRIMMIDPPQRQALFTRYPLIRPFLIVDGINLTTKGKSLEDFKSEIEYFKVANTKLRPEGATGDILGGLTIAGYTPVLVQFPQSTNNSLQTNARIFAALLHYLGRNILEENYVGMAQSKSSFNILGISQGGVIGRYGAYLYDSQKNATEPPVRLFASLDSPHQGAIMPRGMLAALDFWGRERSQAEAKAFLDVVNSPGASELLLYQVKARSKTTTIGGYHSIAITQIDQLPGSVDWSASADRWLFGAYRQAANYKGFPVVMLSNGKLDGEMNYAGTSTLYSLNRWSEKGGGAWGGAESKSIYTTDEQAQYAFNRVYKKFGYDHETKQLGSTRWDLVQGSTFPFIDKIYAAFEPAFLKAIPDRKDILNFRFYGKWDAHEKKVGSTTFIPTTSSLDLQCGGDLSVRNDCVFSQVATGIDWEQPGAITSANAIYAVDPGHPNATQPNSGLHVLGATTTMDLWRLFCEVAKRDYDPNIGTFHNGNWTENFEPNTSCMDPTAISPWFLQHVAPQSFVSSELFPWARWTFNDNQVDKDFPVSFTLPSGWQKVALFGKSTADFAASDVIEVTVQTLPEFSANWLKVEMVLSTNKTGAGWWQLSEQAITADGLEHTVRWQLPSNAAALEGYRWATLIMNSLGGGVKVSSVRILKSNLGVQVPAPIPSAVIYPAGQSYWNLGAWGQHNTDYADAKGSGIALNLAAAGAGAFWYLADYNDLSAYSQLQVTFWPGTCQKTQVYFDKKDNKYNAATGQYGTNSVLLSGGGQAGGWETKNIPLTAIIDQQTTPLNTLSALRLYFVAPTGSEQCIIHQITLQ